MRGIRGWGVGTWIGLVGLAFGQSVGALAVLAADADHPVLFSVFPPGVTVGSEAVWTLRGRNLAGVDQFRIGGGGIAVIGRKSLGDEVIELTVRAAAAAQPGFVEVFAQGPGGFSNPRIVRIDPLPQVQETEPNNDPAHASPVRVGHVANGQLGLMDVDFYEFSGRRGQRIVIEVEALRLGAPIEPLVTLTTRSGAALAQGRAHPGGDREVSLIVTLPTDDTYVVQIRDTLFGAQVPEPGRSTPYRIRIHEGPLATGIFPLGGPAGEGRPKRLGLPTTVNGQIARPGEVDPYRVHLRAGETIRIQVQAAALGSWLDSVVTLRDAQGQVLAANDDAGDLSVLGWRETLRPSLPSFQDSALDYEATADSDVRIEVADRYGAWGPEYGYRLRVEPAEPDFAIVLRLDDFPGVWNLKPGSTATIPFRITMEGQTGPIVVTAEGLPRGVTAEPVRVNVLGARQGPPPRPGARPSRILDGSLVLQVADKAAPAVGEFRIVATAEIDPDQPPRTRVATALLPLDVTRPAEGLNRPSRIVSFFLVAIGP